METAVYLLGGIGTPSLVSAMAIAFSRISSDIKRREGVVIINANRERGNRENAESYQEPHL